MIVDDAPARTYRMSEDVPARTYRMSAELRDDPAQVACLRDYFEDVLDQIYPPDRNRGYGYAAGPSDAQEPPGDGSGPGAARHGRSRRGSVNRAGAAALTAVAVVGTGVSAGVFGIVPFLTPAATAHHVTSPVAAAGPRARTVSGPAAPVRLHAAYSGKHRKPVPAAAAASSPSAVVAPAQAAPSSPAGGQAAGAHAAGASQSGSGTSPRTSVPPRSGGTGASTGTSTGTGGGQRSAGSGLVGGLVGGVTGLVNGLTSSL
jgi:hypothetical protein